MIFQCFEEKKLNYEDIKSLILLWREKNETVFEITGLVNLLNKKQEQIELSIDAVDMCGTGGDRLNTFNISTLSAIVASSFGINVIKHSGRSSTSISGSLDILSDFGISFDNFNEINLKEFKKTRLMFTSSKLLREMFGEVKKVSKDLAIPSFVNLLGPLTNPYKTKFQLLGVSQLSLAETMATSLQSLGRENAIVVCSEAGKSGFMDEFSFCGKNFIVLISKNKIIKKTLNPEDFGVNIMNIEDLIIQDKKEAKLIFENILKGINTSSNSFESKVKVVALNAGSAIYLLKKANSIQEGYKLALQHIKSGKCWEHFQEFLNSSIRNIIN